MEGALATSLVLAIALIMTIIVFDRKGKVALVTYGVLFVIAIIVNQLPIIPHIPDNDMHPEVFIICVAPFIGGVILLIAIEIKAYRRKVTNDEILGVLMTWLFTAVAILAIGIFGRKVFHYPLYNESGNILEYATEFKTEPTGAETVLYENNKNITLEKETDTGWKNVLTITTADELITNQPFRVAKNGETMDIPSVGDTEYTEVNGIELLDAYRTTTNIRVTKVTLVERAYREVLRVDSSRIVHQWTDNKIVVEYEITNMDEVKQHMAEDKQKEQTKTQTKEELQQFVTPTKGD